VEGEIMRDLREIELPFVPTVIVGAVLLVASVVALADVRFYYDCGCRFDGTPVCCQCSGGITDDLRGMIGD
jgi:hypothetical protein